MREYNKVEGQMIDYASEFPGDYDIDSIVRELESMGVEDIGDIDAEVLHEIMQRNEVI